jgi:hypothetical protein
MKDQIKSRVVGQSSAVYGMGFLGAAIYYIQHATTFWMGIVAFFKDIFWPAFLVYKVLESLKM